MSQDPYFFTGYKEKENILKYYLVKIWPYVYKFLNSALYIFIKVTKATVKLARKQMRI